LREGGGEGVPGTGKFAEVDGNGQRDDTPPYREGRKLGRGTMEALGRPLGVPALTRRYMVRDENERERKFAPGKRVCGGGNKGSVVGTKATQT